MGAHFMASDRNVHMMRCRPFTTVAIAADGC